MYAGFAEALTAIAAEVPDPRLTAITERVTAPLRVAVRGRRGVGRRAVASALADAGVAVLPEGGTGVSTGVDVVVQVVAEVVKPEDSEAVADLPQPGLLVLNKVDLCPPTPGHCARLAALTGVPVEPMIGLLAAAELDDTRWAALRALAAQSDRVSRTDRQALLALLDRFGVARAVAAIRRGDTREQVTALLHRLSRVDAVVARIGALGAEAAYRRLRDGVTDLAALAVGEAGVAAIGDLLACDDTVIARMATAEAVLGAARPDSADPATFLQRAAVWQRYCRGPVSELHRACADDIARGSLRLWARAGGAL